jgi:hypothetical protein
VEGDDAAGGNRDLLAGLGIAPGTLRLVAQLEIAEAGQLDAVAFLQRKADFVEESFDHVFGFTLVEADLVEQQIGEFRLGQCHFCSAPCYPRKDALKSRAAIASRSAITASTSASSRVR